ncbi:hypothetical protein QBC34DRAFT_422491 [Podospora aff. communis PSN243]|uniref:EGF-like domain-containing protein n=1 Tax=Podospora aff. communis PSN243 TaxID=3040156 RepID=A0AAV9GX12_9PEZI|nr:hypothetical protein QBC34DRAFT_422491 [Podospora aff. communis PSN243]
MLLLLLLLLRILVLLFLLLLLLQYTHISSIRFVFQTILVVETHSTSDEERNQFLLWYYMSSSHMQGPSDAVSLSTPPSSYTTDTGLPPAFWHPNIADWHGEVQSHSLPLPEGEYQGSSSALESQQHSSTPNAMYPNLFDSNSTSTTHPNTDIRLILYIQPDPPPRPDPGDGLHLPIEYHSPTGPVPADNIDPIPTDSSSPPPLLELSTQTRVSVRKEVCHCEHPFENGVKCKKVFGRYTELH